jgi:hypothetical protein
MWLAKMIIRGDISQRTMLHKVLYRISSTSPVGVQQAHDAFPNVISSPKKENLESTLGISPHTRLQVATPFVDNSITRNPRSVA